MGQLNVGVAANIFADRHGFTKIKWRRNNAAAFSRWNKCRINRQILFGWDRQHMVHCIIGSPLPAQMPISMVRQVHAGRRIGDGLVMHRQRIIGVQLIGCGNRQYARIPLITIGANMRERHR